MRRGLGALLLVGILLVWGPPLRAQARHLVGFGVGVGVRVSNHDLAAVTPELVLPDLEIGVFGPRERSLEIVIPVLRAMASAVLVERLWIGVDVYATFRRRLRESDGGGSTWGVAGPGAGIMVSSGAGSATAGPRLAGRAGVEIRNPTGGTVAFLVQPYLLLEMGDVGVAVSGGAQAVVRVAWIR